MCSYTKVETNIVSVAQRQLNEKNKKKQQPNNSDI